MIGKRFGRLTVIEQVTPTTKWRRRWKCVCVCGGFKNVDTNPLMNGRTQSCGCLHKEATKKAKTTHGMTGSPYYKRWRNMMNRCHNPNDAAYRHYGARGIKVCKRWHDIRKFYGDMGHPTAEKNEIERLNNDGDYCPKNCIWANDKTQVRNRRNTRRVSFDGKEMPLIELCEAFGVSIKVVKQRIDKLGWGLQEALSPTIGPQGKKRGRI